MPRGTEDSLDRLQRAEQLIYEGNLNESRSIIESLEKKTISPLNVYSPLICLKVKS